MSYWSCVKSEERKRAIRVWSDNLLLIYLLREADVIYICCFSRRADSADVTSAPVFGRNSTISDIQIFIDGVELRRNCMSYHICGRFRGVGSQEVAA